MSNIREYVIRCYSLPELHQAQDALGILSESVHNPDIYAEKVVVRDGGVNLVFDNAIRCWAGLVADKGREHILAREFLQ